jgi:myosin I
MAADNSFIQRTAALATNAHFEARGSQFLVKHYAGDVMYQVAGMTDKNKDALIKDLLDLVTQSGNAFLQGLFPERPDPNSKKRPPTAGDRIKVSETSFGGSIDPTFSIRFRHLQERWSRILCVHNRHTFVRSNRTRTGVQQNMTPRRSSTRSSTLACKRISEFVVRVSHIAIRLRRWWSGFIFYLPTPHMQENTHGRVTLAADVRKSSLTLGSRRRSGKWV